MARVSPFSDFARNSSVLLLDSGKTSLAVFVVIV